METHLTKAKWNLDTSHSELLFKVKHLMISNIKGEFRKFTAEIDGDDFTKDPITVSIETGSIFTNDEKRDEHLRGEEFFDSAKFPEIHFESSSILPNGVDHYYLKGVLTIKDISKEVVLHLIYNGHNRDPWGNEKAGFSLSGTINRSDWGLIWNTPLETGGFLLGEIVQLNAEIQMVRHF